MEEGIEEEWKVGGWQKDRRKEMNDEKWMRGQKE